jgi:enoyl-CoA hydratase/carnithine racemase
MNEQVNYTCEDNIAVIRIDNPPVNALAHSVRSALIESIDRFEADETAEAAIIIGSGRVFSAGADIKEFSKPAIAPTITDVTTITISQSGNAIQVCISVFHRISGNAMHDLERTSTLFKNFNCTINFF